MSETKYTCRCGELDGVEHCQWEGPISRLVVVEYMPIHLRSSHEAARNSGSYPHNGAVRVAVNWECAAALAGEWCSEVEMRPNRYAERVGEVR